MSIDNRDVVKIAELFGLEIVNRQIKEQTPHHITSRHTYKFNGVYLHNDHIENHASMYRVGEFYNSNDESDFYVAQSVLKCIGNFAAPTVKESFEGK